MSLSSFSRSTFRAAGAEGEALFSPTDIAGLKLWLDASDESTITESGGAVSQWDDKSGNGNHATQGTASLQPTTGGTTRNGRNVVEFADDVMDTGYTPSYPFTVVAVVQYNTPENDGFAGRYIGNEGNYQVMVQSNLTGVAQVGGSSVEQSSVTSASDGDYLVVVTVLDGASSRVDVNGILGEAGNPGLSTPTGMLIGARNSNATDGPYTGPISEICVIEGRLKNSVRDKLESYMSSRWNVTVAEDVGFFEAGDKTVIADG